jgi:hypothetical protein
MSAEVGVVLLVPALAGGLLVAGAGYLAVRGIGALAGAAGDRLSERQQRSWAAADRISRSVAEHALLYARIERERGQFGDRITALAELGDIPSAGAHPGRAEAESTRIDALVQAADQRFRAEVAAARSGRIMAEVVAALDRLPRPAPAPGRPERTSAARPTAPVAESLERVLGRIGSGVPPTVSAMLQSRAADALRAHSEATALRLLNDLRYAVDQANERAHRRRDTLRELTGRMSGYAGPAIEDARARLVAAYDEPEPDLPGLGRAVDAAIEATLAPAVREYTRRALRESLEEIGCTVEEDFEVALGRDGMAHVRGPGWDDLAVRVRTRGGENAYHFNLVAPADGAEPDVTALEHQWCSAVDQLMPALTERGVEVRTTHRSEEGDAEVQYVDPARFPFERRRQAQRRQADQQRRERPR